MLSKISLKGRIAAVALPTMVLSVTCTLVLAVNSYKAIDQMREKAEELSERSVRRVATVSDLRASLMKASITLRDITLAASDAERQKFLDRRTQSITDIVTKLKDLRSDPSPGEEELFKRMDTHIADISGAVEKFDSIWKGKIGANGEVEFETRRSLADAIWNVAVPIRNKLEDTFGEFRDLEVKHQDELAKKAQSLYLEMRSELVVVGILSVALAALSTATIVFYIGMVAKRLSGLARALRRSSNAVDSTSRSVAASSTHLASSTTEEASSIAETAAAMEEMTATIAKTVQNVGTTLEVAEDGQQEAQRGREVVGKMLVAMNEIQSTNVKLEKMIKLIEEIKDKTRVINDIVFETRLLSFNASIEAARAGSQGRGFAVVAEEVGNLAVVSGKAADEIRILLESSTSEVNEIVRGTQERINQGRARAEECEKAFGGMGESLSRVCQYVRGISAAAQEQDSGVKQINRAMAQLDTVTQTNATEAEGLNAQASDLSNESQNMSNAVSQLYTCVFGSDDDVGDDEGPAAPRGHRPQERKLRAPANVRTVRTSKDGGSLTAARDAGSQGEHRSAGLDPNDPHPSHDLDLVDRDDPRWRAA